MMDIDTFVADCLAARAEPDAHRAINELLTRACSRPGALADALPPERAEIQRLHVSPELTVLKVVWAPGMSLRPHDHRMWARIGIYTGREDNILWKPTGEVVEASGAASLSEKEVFALPQDAIHSVTNPIERLTGAIHIYGGDFFLPGRSEWDAESLRERPFDLAAARRSFEQANRRFQAGR